MQIALLGGSFNPPHIGHLMGALYVHSTMGVDEVWLMPSFRHPFGKPLVEFEHRIAMCEAMAKEVGGWLQVTQIERELDGEGRTVDTLAHLLPKFPEHQFSLVIGSDILRDLPNWKDFDRIQKMVPLIVLHRAGYPAPEAEGPPLVEVSSSQIRSMFEAGQLPAALVPSVVLAYARTHRLYGLA